MFKILFHSSTPFYGRFPALQTKISRQANQRNYEKILKLKTKLQTKYRLIGRDKRNSPFTQRRSSSKPTQMPLEKHWNAGLSKFLIRRSNMNPAPFVPMDPGKIPMSAIEEYNETKSSVQKEKLKNQPQMGSTLSMPSRDEFKKDLVVSDHNTPLELDAEKAIPKIGDDISDHLRTQYGPYYQYSLSPQEAKFLFQDVPATVIHSSNSNKPSEQGEILRRILSMDIADAGQIRRFNTARVVEIFQEHEMDTGSSQVQGMWFLIQVAAMEIKAKAMEIHVKTHPKDISSKRKLEIVRGKQKKMLKYLKRKDLAKFIQSCQMLGINPKRLNIK